MTFHHGQCKATTSKNKPCSVGAMDSVNGFCGPHLTQALNKAKAAFEGLDTEEAAYFAQLAQAMVDREVDANLPFLRDNFRRIRGEN